MSTRVNFGQILNLLLSSVLHRPSLTFSSAKFTITQSLKNLSQPFMPVTRSPIRSKLIPRPSPFSSSVTLFETSDVSTVVKEEELELSGLRRSKRSRIVEKKVSHKDEGDENDFESLVKAEPVSPSSKLRSPKKRKLESLNETPLTPASPAKKSKPLRMHLEAPHPAPENWRTVYEEIEEMRKLYVAPVDTMGCASAQLQETDPEVSLFPFCSEMLNSLSTQGQRMSTLVSLMLSSQTKDEVTAAATMALRKALGGSITVEALIAADDSTISEAIAKVGFWRRKTG